MDTVKRAAKVPFLDCLNTNKQLESLIFQPMEKDRDLKKYVFDQSKRV